MSWTIDPSHTSVEFSAKHMMVSTVRGRFGHLEGVVDFNAEQPTLSTVEGSVDIASITTGDANRDNHLRSPDFFDVATYPKMYFRSTRIEHVDGNRYKVYGDLTIRDVTREIVWDVLDEGKAPNPWGSLVQAVSASTSISRKDFGMLWNVALETGGWLVSDKINITADMELLKSATEAQPVAEAAA